MLKLRDGSYVFLLLEVLCAVGELPMSALPLLGSYRSIRAAVHRGEIQQEVMLVDGQIVSARLFSISGSGKQKTLRLHKEAIPLLSMIHPMAKEVYMIVSHDHHFAGIERIVDRNHRVAETAVMCLRAGAEFRPYKLPQLQLCTRRAVLQDGLCCYLSRNIKDFPESSMAKVGFGRCTGLLFTPYQPYALYNARTATMKWSGTAESKAQLFLMELVVKNSPHTSLDSAILFASDGTVALETVLETMKPSRTDMHFPQVFPHIHFLPLSPDGLKLFRLLVQPDAKERILEALLPDSMRIRQSSFASCDCDAVTGDKYILSHLDGDIARLIRFRYAAATMPKNAAFEVICYPWQLSYVQPYLKDRIAIRCIDPDALEAAME